MTEPHKFNDRPEVTGSSSTTKRSILKKSKFEPEVQDAETMIDSDEFEELEILQMQLALTETYLLTYSQSDAKPKNIQNAVQMKSRPNGYDNQQIIEAVVSSQSAQSTDPLMLPGPSKSAGSSERAGPSELAGPSKPTGPSDLPGPSKPTSPSKSTSPSEPASPSEPSTSTASQSPSYQSLLLQKKALKFEIDNIGKVMSCYTTAVKRWLSVIDDKENPEKEYLQEYKEGTDKLHELQCKEMELEDKQEKVLELVKLRKLRKTDKKTGKVSTILVHLPNKEHTVIKRTEGVTLRQALFIPFQRRQLILEDCAAYIRQRVTHFISWDTDISTLDCKEVFVETLEFIPVPVFFTHNFVGSTFLLGYCNFCSKSLLSGVYCKDCNRKYHTKCVIYSPLLCEHIKRRRAYYERLLANNPVTGIVQIPPRPVLVPSICRRRDLRNSIPRADKTTQVRAVPRFHVTVGSKMYNQIEKKRQERKRKKEKRQEERKRLAVQGKPITDDAFIDSEEDSIFSRDSIDEWKFDIEDVIIGEEIGEGTFGRVFHAEWMDSHIAVKKLKIENPTPELRELFKNEVNVLRRARHDHVLYFLGCICKPFLGIMTSFCNGPSLYDRLYDDEYKKIPLEIFTLVLICRQTSEGMDYLHARNILHRDLKSRNIFLHDGMHVKIGDFGLAMIRDKKLKPEIEDSRKRPELSDAEKEERSKKAQEEHEQQLAGSIPWMAPEVLRMKINENPYSCQSDVYAFGIVMFELFARSLPYPPHTDRLYILYNVGRGSLSPDLRKLRPDMPTKLKRLLIQCISFEKEKRPFFPYILRRTYAAFKYTPKITRTTSLPVDAFVLADTYIEKAEDAQVFLTSDIEDSEDDYVDADADANADANVASDSIEDIFADF